MSVWEGWLVVAAGGAIGALGRAAIQRAVARWLPVGSRGIPGWLAIGHATLIVNVVGSFVLGLVLAGPDGPEPLGALSAATPLSGSRLFWSSGICGSLTTFSTFAADAVGLARRRDPLRLTVYLIANGVLCVAAIAVGVRLGSG